MLTMRQTMRQSIAGTRNIPSVARRLALLALAGMMLAGCETTGSTPAAQAAGPPAPPMTHSRAAMECWMATEKGHGSADLDKRADIVTRCIDDKMKSAAAQG